MGDKEDYLTSYRVFFENFAATVNPEDQLPVNIAGYTITESELPGEVIYWTTQYLTEKQCPLTLMTPLRRIILEEVQAATRKQPNEFGYRADDSVYIALRLMQAVTAKVNEVCLRYLDNSRLDALPAPARARDLRTVSAAAKNSRRAMEDRHVEIGNLEALFGIETTEPTSFYAVYDGHAGSAAATYCAAHLHQYLVESSHFASNLSAALREAYLRTDVEFVRKSNQERACGGSTAVSVCVRARRLTAAWAGDSQALLVKRMGLMQLVNPHKPDRRDERDRIESSGGTVMYWGTWRVNGQLAVSRAIGDAQYKPYVTACPEIATVDLDGDEDFVVIACDGLWDFVSEDQVALEVYWQLKDNPNDLKTVTSRLILRAKNQGSSDNITVIVVFLKEPRLIAADNSPPMELGLDNALASSPPFPAEADACKRPLEAAESVANGAEAAAPADNGADNSDSSDSDGEDLGPETAVDAEDADAQSRHSEPAAPTPPADTVEQGHVDGPVEDNVGESGDDSEDEWNYFKGEGEKDRKSEEQPVSEEPDEPPRSETPCQDNSAWESSSVDMNSSPLNPDAPVFVPGTIATEVLLAESPRKPLSMDDIELPDVAQFETEVVGRPAEILDLDNCDQLNGHHNISLDEAKEHLNGNDKCNMDSLGFGFGVGVDPDKTKDTTCLLQDLERIQKDTTDFCNIQMFQAHTEIDPLTEDIDEELIERLKNKERDPMSMSFYQEKDDDTCERLGTIESNVDLNAVQTLPESDDEDTANGVCDNVDYVEKENINPEQLSEKEQNYNEPNNDIMHFDQKPDIENNPSQVQGDNFNDYIIENANNVQSFANIDFECGNVVEGNVIQTDTPESHKLLFEQIPEIPDGKSSVLGFVGDDAQDTLESEKGAQNIPQDDSSHDIDMIIKEFDNEQVASPTAVKEIPVEATIEAVVEQQNKHFENMESEIPPSNVADELKNVFNYDYEQSSHLNGDSELSKVENVNNDTGFGDTGGKVEHCDITTKKEKENQEISATGIDVKVSFESEVPMFTETPTSGPSPLPSEIPLPRESPIPMEAQFPVDSILRTQSLQNSTESLKSPLPSESPIHSESFLPVTSPMFMESPLPTESPLPPKSPLHGESLLPTESPLLAGSPHPKESPLPVDEYLPVEISESSSPMPAEQTLPSPVQSVLPTESPAPSHVEQLTQFNESLLPSLPNNDFLIDNTIEERLTPEVQDTFEITQKEMTHSNHKQDIENTLSGATPDIVPEESLVDNIKSRTDLPSELVTDIDIGIPESRAQEICVPVTNEITIDDVIANDRVGAGTPPPTPAAAPSAPPLADLHAQPAVAGAAAVVAAAAAAAATAVAKPKPPSAKKTPSSTKATTPAAKTAPRTTTTPKTPTTTKRVVGATSAAKPSAPTSATKAAPAAKTAVSATKTTATRPSGAKPTTPRTPTAPRPAPAKSSPAPAKEAPAKPAAAKPATAARLAPARPAAAKPAPKPAAAAAPRAPAARPAPRAAPKAAPAARPAPAAKAPEKKPLTNGDAKAAPIRRPAAPAPGARPAARPLAKPAPRPTPRAASATATAAQPNKTASAPKPAPRAPPRPPLDKQSKDLANKRITAKAAPPRTAATKAPTGTKIGQVKSVPKKAPEAVKKTEELVLSNGSAAADAALPDVIA